MTRSKFDIAKFIVECNHELSPRDLMEKLLIEYVEQHYPEEYAELKKDYLIVPQ